jgi:mannosyltransferase OCH1-like enzyme
MSVFRQGTNGSFGFLAYLRLPGYGVISYNRDYDDQFNFPELLQMIPKIIWQTHECPYDELPELYKTNSQTYKDLGWDYRYNSASDRQSFIEEHFPQYLHLYLHIGPGIYRADFWRYLVLYKYGGFYVDMDSFCDFDKNAPENQLTISLNSTFSVWMVSDNTYTNAIIMCSKKNSVMKQIIKAMVDKCQENYDQGFKVFPDANWLYATGPEMYSSVINNNIDKIDNINHYDGMLIKHGGLYRHQMDAEIYSNFHPGSR